MSCQKSRLTENSDNSKRLKIPPAFVADEWVCNHNHAKKKLYLDSLNLNAIKFTLPKISFKSNRIQNDSKLSSLCKANSDLKRSNQCSDTSVMLKEKKTKKNLLNSKMLPKIISKDMKFKNKNVKIKTKSVLKKLETKELSQSPNFNLKANDNYDTAKTSVLANICDEDNSLVDFHNDSCINKDDNQDKNVSMSPSSLSSSDQSLKSSARQDNVSEQSFKPENSDLSNTPNYGQKNDEIIEK
jgi:hypothetical protein